MKQITKFIYMALAAALALTACSPDDNYNLGESNISDNMFSFNAAPGSDEWTYNFEVAFNVSPTIYGVEIQFGDGAASVKGRKAASHEYVALKGSTFTAKCIVTAPTGETFTKDIQLTMQNDNPKALVDDPKSFLYALTGGKANTAGKAWYIGAWTAMRNTANRDEIWWDFKNAATANDKFTLIPGGKYGLDLNGKFIYDNAGDSHINESLGDLFPDGSTAGSFVTTHFTPPTDATWAISESGGKTYLILTKGFLSYATAPSDLEKTEYEVLSFSTTTIRVAHAGNPIWCYELTNEAPGASTGGTWVDVNSADNLWHGVNFKNSFYIAHGNDWSSLPTQELTISGNQYSISFPDATNLQWQNQVTFVTDNVSTTAAEKYDFRVTLNASNDIKQATMKLTQAVNSDNDAVFIFTERVDLTAGKDVVVELTDMDGKDMDPVKLVFDFGGNPANTNLVIKDIILQKHKK